MKKLVTVVRDCLRGEYLVAHAGDFEAEKEKTVVGSTSLNQYHILRQGQKAGVLQIYPYATWLRSSDKALDEYETGLEQKIADAVHDHNQWLDDEDKSVVRFGFYNSLDEALSVFPVTRSWDTSPRIVGEGKLWPRDSSGNIHFLLGNVNFKQPNKIVFYKAQVTPEVVVYRRGRYLVRLNAVDIPPPEFTLEIPEPFDFGHVDLSFMWPLSLKNLKKLIWYELEMNGYKREVPSSQRYFDVELEPKDMSYLAKTMQPWQPSRREGFFQALEKKGGSKESPLCVDRDVIDKVLEECKDDDESQ